MNPSSKDPDPVLMIFSKRLAELLKEKSSKLDEKTEKAD